MFAPRMFTLGATFFAACLLLAAADVFWGFWDHDAGFFFNQSAMIAQGLRPYVDFATIYPPLFTGLHALVIDAGVDRWTMIWAVPMFWILANSALTILYLTHTATGSWSPQKLHPWLTGGAFALFSIDSGGNHYTLEHGVVFFGMLSLLLSRGMDLRALFFAGFAVSCATLSKQVGILLLLPYLTQVKSLKHAAAFIAGLLIPLLACLAWVGFDLNAIHRSTEMLNRYVSSAEGLGIFALLSSFVLAYLRDMARAPWLIMFALASLVLGIFSLGTLYRERKHRDAAWLVAWLFIGVVYLAARAKNNFPHYTLNVWPSIVVIIGASAKLLPPATLRRVFSVALVGSVLFTGAFSWRLKTLEGKPYFTRWQGEGRIFFLKRVSHELASLLPGGASVTHLGMEESVILFLSGRVPYNKDWSPHDMVAPVVGDAILFTDYGQLTATEWRAKFASSGYQLRREWSAPKWGKVQLYQR